MIIYFFGILFAYVFYKFIWRKKTSKQFTSVIITGASRGIGREMAIQFAKKINPPKLFLIARSKAGLEDVATECSKYGADVHIHQVDVTHKNHMRNTIEKIFEQYHVDLVIANAGITLYTSGIENLTDAVYQMYDINIYGVLNTILPTIEFMKKNKDDKALSKKSGTIAIIGSQASCMVLPGASSFYASSKAVIGHLRGLRTLLKSDGIDLAIIQPGYIKTAMTERTEETSNVHNFIMDLDESCQKIIGGLEEGNNEISFPASFYYLMNFVNILPWFIQEKIWEFLPDLILGEKY